MRLKDGFYRLSGTDLKRLSAHVRGLARRNDSKPDAFTECWLDAASGKIHIARNVSINYRMKGEHAELVCSVYNHTYQNRKGIHHV